ncbi:MAG: hypothetical protein KKD77_22550 [Gammaproteobacteria bacterium]|nr:hypothetical protein [Gammaproteobacteria bacterium]
MNDKCSGLNDERCREEILIEISRRPTSWGIIKILSIPLGILGVIVLLISLIYNQSIKLNSLAVERIADVVIINKENNSKQDERIRSMEMNQVEYTVEAKSIAASIRDIKESIRRIENDKTSRRPN